MNTCVLAQADAVNWADIEPHLEELGMTGQFYTLRAVDVMLWVPGDLQSLEELPEEMVEKGLTASFVNEANEKAINVVYTDIGGMSLDEYAEKLPDLGAEYITKGTINGIDAVEYYLPSNETMNIAYITDSGNLLEFTLTPFNTEDKNAEWAVVIASIQPAA